MSNHMVFRGIWVLVVLAVSSATAISQKAGKHSVGTKASVLRYVIVHNEVDPSLGRGDSDRRFVEALMDPRSFSKKNVAVLGRLVSNRFAAPALLYINIFTSLNDVETPEERDESKVSNSASDGPNRRDTSTCVRLNNNLRCLIYFYNGKHDEIEVKLSN